MTYYIVNGVLLATNICLLVWLFCQLRLAKRLNAATAQVHADAKAVLVRVRILKEEQEEEDATLHSS